MVNIDKHTDLDYSNLRMTVLIIGCIDECIKSANGSVVYSQIAFIEWLHGQDVIRYFSYTCKIYELLGGKTCMK